MTAPVNTIAPVVSFPGSTSARHPIIGQTLICSVGTWTGTDPIAFTYQWRNVSGAADIVGATSPTFVPDISLFIATLGCNVTAINSSGSSTASSNTTSQVSNVAGDANPLNTTAPSISGNVLVGETLTVNPGTWIGMPPTFSYQWQSYATGAWINIFNEIQNSYLVRTADVGQQLRCVVLGVNIASRASAVSAAVTISNTAPATSPLSSVQRQHRGPKWDRSVNGAWATEKHVEDVDCDRQDWSDALGGESIVSATWSTDGITLQSSSYDDTTTTVTVTGIGSAHVDITTSGGRTFRTYFTWRRLERPIMNDYGGGDMMPGDYR